MIRAPRRNLEADVTAPVKTIGRDSQMLGLRPDARAGRKPMRGCHLALHHGKSVMAVLCSRPSISAKWRTSIATG